MENNIEQPLQQNKNQRLEYALFLFLGFLLGIIIKTEAVKRITIGFEDYRLISKGNVYEIIQLEKSLKAKAEAEQAKEEEEQPTDENDQGAEDEKDEAAPSE